MNQTCVNSVMILSILKGRIDQFDSLHWVDLHFKMEALLQNAPPPPKKTRLCPAIFGSKKNLESIAKLVIWQT